MLSADGTHNALLIMILILPYSDDVILLMPRFALLLTQTGMWEKMLRAFDIDCMVQVQMPSRVWGCLFVQ